MRKSKIYVRGEHTEAVKQGWSWPAFFFAPLWALVKGLWIHAIAFVAAVYGMFFVTIHFVESLPALELLPGLFTVALWILFGALGNKWREQRLRLKGYTLSNAEEKIGSAHEG